LSRAENRSLPNAYFGGNKMSYFDHNACERNLTQREINAYEDWKDSPERYE